MARPLLVAGAGLAGLSTAYHARGKSVVVDREKAPGGTARSVEAGGFTFDFTGHLLHLHNDYTRGLVRELLGENWVACRRDARIYSHGALTPYPFQANLFGLPKKVVADCVDGVRQARRLYGERPALDGLFFKDWALRLFGTGISRHFMLPYNEKLWRTPAGEMTPEWCGGFVPVPTLKEVEAGARKPLRKAFGYNTEFIYPKKGGIQVLPEALARRVKDLRLGLSLEAVDWRRKSAALSDGKSVSYSRLVSTLPLPELLKRLQPFPEALAEPLSRLRWTTVLCINVGVARAKISPASWIYFPEKKFPFYRVGFPMNFTPHVVPEGCSSMYVEVSFTPGTEPADAAGRQRLFRRVRAGLEAAGILRGSDRLPVVQFIPIRYAYVVYDAHRRAALDRIFGWLKSHDMDSIGRYGGWKYSFMEEAILDGKKAAEAAGSW